MKNIIFCLMLLFAPVACSDSSIADNDGSGGVQMFGDSIFATSDHRIGKQLAGLANVTIADHSVSGSVVSQIRDQYLSHRSEQIRTVILDGGGNDILGNKGNCQNKLNDACKSLIKKVVDVVKETFSHMANDGIHQIVYLGCHYPMGWNAGFNQAVDYSYPLLADACYFSPVPCILVDPRQTFKDRSDLLEWDGIHPNWNGTDVMAKLIWSAVQANKIDL